MKLRNGAIINDRYIIDEKIGSGGMAIVYRATDTKLDRVVTLKVMREDYIQDDEFIERFYTEAQAAARLNHPNIVKVYDVDRIGDILFIVMEYINGITLKEAIRARKMFTNEEVLGVSIQIASAIDCAHKNYIIHRDIKPQNILLTPMGEVKVTDFGIARAANAKTTTATATTLGSVHYFSPEQARGGYVDHKSDIYALGITMFEMASGRLPFDDETVVTIALKHINDDLPDLKSINPGISESVIQIINHATEKSQMRRYENAEIMGNDLKKALTNESLGGYKDYEDLSLTQTLKISQADMNKIREKSHKNVDIENVSDEYRDDIKTVGDVERRKYQEQQRNNLRGKGQQQRQGQRSNQQRQEELSNIKDGKKENKNKILIYAILTGLLLAFVVMGSFFFAFKNTLRQPMDVPNLVKMTLDEAKEKGKLEGFEVEVIDYAESQEYEAGTIMDQDFQDGDKFYAGGTIKVVVSEGYDSVVVPDVLDLLEADAVRQLEEAGFEVRVRDTVSEEVREGRVAEQAPKAQNVAPSGSTVTVYISSGEEKPEQTTVPNVKGMTESAAQTAITNAKLNVNVSYTDSSFTTKGNVISQSINGGEKVDVQTEITIVVSTGAAEEGTGNEVETTEKPPVTKTVIVDQTMIPSGYETVVVRVVTDSTGVVIYEQEVGVNDFPINISVTGKGSESYTVFTKIEGGTFTPSVTKEVIFE